MRQVSSTRTRLALRIVCVSALAAAAVWFVWSLRGESGAESVNVRIREHREVVLVTTESAALDSLAARVGFTPAMPDPLPSGTKRLFEVESLLFGEVEAVTPRSFLRYMGSGSRPEDGWLMVVQSSTYWGQDLSEWSDVDVGPLGGQVKIPNDDRIGGWEYWILGKSAYIYVLSLSPSPPDFRTQQMLRSLVGQVD